LVVVVGALPPAGVAGVLARHRVAATRLQGLA
jgi:hypothetical protein